VSHAPPETDRLCSEDWESLQRYTAHMHAERARAFPLRVEAGKMDRADADRGIRIMGAIAADVHMFVTTEPRPADAPAATLDEILTELTVAGRRARALANSKPSDRTAEQRAIAIDLLHAQYLRPFNFVRCAETTLALRARIAAERAAAALKEAA